MLYMADKKFILGYWGISALGQPIRYLLSYAEADWKDEAYTDQAKWFDTDKKSLGIPFANLPYLIDGDYKLTESTAILKYLPKRLDKLELLGKTLEDQGRVDQLLGVIGDMQSAAFTSFKTEGWQEKKQESFDTFKTKIHLLQDFVKENWALGYLTIVDFKLADFIYMVTQIYPEQSKDLKKLSSISKSVHELPQIKKYLETGVKTLLPPFAKLNVSLP